MSRKETQPSKVGNTSIQHLHPPQDDLKSRLASINAEIRRQDIEIAKMQDLRESFIQERAVVLDKMKNTRTSRVIDKGKGKLKEHTVDYMTEPFEWSGELLSRMKKVFGISDFRFCQKGWALLVYITL